MRPKASPWPFVGIGGLACLVFLYGASVLYMPWWLVVVLGLVWLALLARALRWFTPRPTATAWLPVVGFGCWLVAVGVTALLRHLGEA
ncbi:MAG: hypothetical protein ACRDPH_02530 [Marmoricola sp.]